MDAGDLDDCSVQVISALMARPNRIRALDDLRATIGAQPVDLEAALTRLAAGGLVNHYWIPEAEVTRVPRRRYVELTEPGRLVGVRLRSRPLIRRRGVVGTFLWEGWDAARIAWFARPRRARRHSEGDRAWSHDNFAPMAVDWSEGVFIVLRREGWAAAYGAAVERRRARVQRARHRRQ